MKCFYHNDLDGKCAGAIVYKYYVRDRLYLKENKPVFIPIDYKDRFPFESIGKNELVIIVDFSLQKPGDFECLLDITEYVIWIDHHKSAIEKHGDLNIPGIRRDGTAGCELTWEYFYPADKPVPEPVELIGDYDVWKFKYGDGTRNFVEGIKLHDHDPASERWIDLLNYSDEYMEIARDGRIAIKYRDNYYKELIDNISFFTEFEGYSAVACNACKVNSMLFDSVAGMDFDLMMPFYYDGRVWTVSIYSTKDIDCAMLAEKHGGGGHKSAAGFQCAELPFRRED